MIKVKFENLKQIIKKTNQLKSYMENPRSSLDDIKVLGLNSIDENFAAEGRPKHWDELSPATLAKHERRRGGRLNRTGKLRNSIKGAVRGSNVEWKAGKFYGRFHHFGEGVPKSPFLILQQQDEKKSQEILLKDTAAVWNK